MTTYRRVSSLEVLANLISADTTPKLPVVETPEFKTWFRNSKVVDKSGAPLVVYHGTNAAGFTEFEQQDRNNNDFGFWFSSDEAVAQSYTKGRPKNDFDFLIPRFKTIQDMLEFAADKTKDVSFHVELKYQDPDDDWHKSMEALNAAWVQKHPEDTVPFQAWPASDDIITVFDMYVDGEHWEYWSNDDRDMRKMLKETYEQLKAINKGSGVYECYLSIQDPFVFDAKGENWDNLDFDGETVRTKDIVDFATDNGHDGAFIMNVVDDGGHGGTGSPSNVYVAFEPFQIKAAYSNDGSFDDSDADITSQDQAPKEIPT